MDLNEDLAVQILLRLPVKSVLKVRSVCKSWRDIIDSSLFRKSHFRNQSKNNHNNNDDYLFLQFRESSYTLSSSLFPDNWKSYNEFSADFFEFVSDNVRDKCCCGSKLTVDGPINGLILLYNHTPQRNEHFQWSLSIAICNPALRQVKFLPLSPMCSSLLDSGRKTRDKAFNFRDVSFGFDSVTQEYKVMQVISSPKAGTYVEVYSGRTNTWKVLASNIFDDQRTCYYRKISCTQNQSGTTSYWQILKRSRGGHLDEVVLSFDMHSEVFEKIRLPEGSRDHTVLYVKGDESLVLFAYASVCSKCEVWEMEKTKKGRDWAHVMDVNVGEFGGVDPLPVAVWKDGLVFKCYYWDGYTSKYWILYDYSTDKEREFVELPCDRMAILEYKCSLYSLF